MAEKTIPFPIAQGKSFSLENPVAVEYMPDGNTPAVTSLQLAEHFGIHHRNVLRDIRSVLRKIPQEWGLLNFEQSEYLNAQNKEQPYYLLTRDGFTLLAMGYNSTRAIAWKLRYIAAFNALEAAVLEQAGREGYLAGAAKQREMITRGKKYRRNMARAVAYRAKGLSYPDIAKLLDIHSRAVYQMVQNAQKLGLAE
ncbi:Rha family transcriptional regulator [Desulfovibrio sp. OttesenSCG-928-G15]|nr:Rha family transcriptional regulator [Desulfovibrio sp. OttesenSCG-928-G15]